MTNTEIIQAIRNEIERQIALLPTVGYSTQIAGDHIPVQNTLNYLISFLSTIESKKPMSQKGLTEEVKRYYSENFDYISSDQPTLSILTNVARHFAKWGADHTPLPEDTVLFNKGVEEGKRLMMEEAVETELYWDGDFLAIDLNMAELGYSERDKVRVIICKMEDKK